MAVNTLLDAVTEDTDGTSSALTGPATLLWHGDVADLDGKLVIYVSYDDAAFVISQVIDRESSQAPSPYGGMMPRRR